MFGLFKWFNPLNVMNDCAEGHAFLIGLADGFCFTRTDWSTIHECSTPSEIKEELHYYTWGTWMGRIAFILLIWGLVRSF